MKNILAFITIAIAIIAPAQADATYTSASTFNAMIAPGAYTEDFSGVRQGSNDVVYSGAGFTYTVSANSDLTFNGSFLGTSVGGDALVLTFSGAPVTAVGGNIYATDAFEEFVNLMITVTLNDGTTASYTPTSAADAFIGFTTELAISSLTIGGIDNDSFLALDSLTVGIAAVPPTTDLPEPGSLAIMGLGLAAVALIRRRFAA